MTHDPTPFDSRRDPELGAALSAALEPRDHAAFVQRVVASLDRARPESWTVLAGWARRGVIAAAIAALVLGLIDNRGTAPATVAEESFASGTGDTLPPSALLASQDAPDASVVFASLVRR
ncbi:MAG TPA: hypothetical protein VFK78_08830 [Gemmatimonadales bacterium]|nr:hypothetical protein [Gemmatimonadales bacterium]